MNKSFFTKPISLKNINISKISIKGLKNNKLFFICIFIVIFFIVICVIGANLLNERNIAQKERANAESKYVSLKAAPSKEVMQKEIDVMVEEMKKNEEKLTSIKPAEFTKVLKDFKKDAPIIWEESDSETVLKNAAKGTDEYAVYRVNIKNFSGSMVDVERFLEYTENYKKIVRVDSLKFNRVPATGKLSGQASISFYFKKLEE